MPTDRPDSLAVILGNQLFAPAHLAALGTRDVFMAENVGLCTYVRHHQHKLILFLAAMRHHRDLLRAAGYRVRYIELGEPAAELPYEDALAAHLAGTRYRRLALFEVEDRFFEDRLAAFARRRGLELDVHPSPMFLTPRPQFAAYLAGVRKPMMAGFYQQQRRRLGILLDADGGPAGGQWSFDAENRRRLPADVKIPAVAAPAPTAHVRAVARLVGERFADHPGTADGFWLPVTREQALDWLERFVTQRLALFGDYEDALSSRGDVLFHSVLSPALNLGLLTPAEVVARVLDHAGPPDRPRVPLNAVEGFIRQVIGWREFVRGIDRHFGEQQAAANFWNHHRRLGPAWQAGTTGLPPLDAVLAKLRRRGWCHHIERLMVLSNLMLLCEIQPAEAYRFFMEQFVDSADWVMGPNVYGMGLFSDGGIFATKPYICGSNYLLKMSDHPRGPWCDVVDGLYWRFVARHRAFFEANPRLGMMARGLGRLAPDRRARIFERAEAFLARVTVA